MFLCLSFRIHHFLLSQFFLRLVPAVPSTISLRCSINRSSSSHSPLSILGSFTKSLFILSLRVLSSASNTIYFVYHLPYNTFFIYSNVSIIIINVSSSYQLAQQFGNYCLAQDVRFKAAILAERRRGGSLFFFLSCAILFERRSGPFLFFVLRTKTLTSILLVPSPFSSSFSLDDLST